MAELQVRILVTLDGEAWSGEHRVEVPPDYNERDIIPFIQHETDKAVTEFQRESFGYSRSADIIRQFDRRIVLIRTLLRRAPHDIRRRPIVERIRGIIEMNSDRLFAEFGDESVRD